MKQNLSSFHVNTEHLNKTAEEIQVQEISASAEEVTSSIFQIAIGTEQSVSDFEMIAAATEEQAATIE